MTTRFQFGWGGIGLLRWLGGKWPRKWGVGVGVGVGGRSLELQVAKQYCVGWLVKKRYMLMVRGCVEYGGIKCCVYCVMDCEDRHGRDGDGNGGPSAILIWLVRDGDGDE